MLECRLRTHRLIYSVVAGCGVRAVLTLSPHMMAYGQSQATALVGAAVGRLTLCAGQTVDAAPP
jgi:hypothetical protein